MVILGTITGNLLDATEKYIAQQCNCVTVKPHGLSKSIAERWPYHGNVYAERSAKSANTAQDPDQPGSVVITEPERSDSAQPILLHMMAQWTPSKPCSYSRYYPDTYKDTRANREMWFQQCLDILDAECPADSVVAMPDHIGCGLAGGNWNTYKAMLSKCSTKIRIYKLA
jgi:O-acetyl-ADP-ribose deacetylase (regulator of RNase III)